MEITELLFGVLITIIGVVTVEFIFYYFKERKEIHNLIKSLGYEICENLAIYTENKELIKSRRTHGYIPFLTISYTNFKQHLSEKLIKKIGKEAITCIYVGYIFCINFNNNMIFRSDDEYYLKIADLANSLSNIKTNFDNYQKIEKSNF